VVRQDSEVAELAAKFVCVRMQSMNGVNLNLFSFEGDLTWMAFFMDAEDRIYARYGGREDDHPESLLTKQSLLKVLREVLHLHRTAPAQAGRRDSKSAPVQTPEDVPTMARMMARRKEKCIHCHDVKVARLRHLQNQGAFSREMVFTYPPPSAIGIRLDPDDQRRVASVETDSAAETAGFRVDDRLVSVDGQRILSAADLSNVLELTSKNAKLPVRLTRGVETVNVSLELAGNWRRTVDPSWRESLHVAGPNAGCWGEKLGPAAKQKLGIPADRLAVKVTFIWADYARGAGLQLNDIIVAFDGQTQDMTIRQLHAHLHLKKNYGDEISVEVLRDGVRKPLQLKLPASPPDTD
jgi:predicted metalloprotease with PDZ domain